MDLPRASSSGRSPLFASVRRALRMAALAARPGMPPVSELIEAERSARLSRRALLRTAVGAGSLTAISRSTARGAEAGRSKGPRPRIAIVGAGLAGLNAAFTLKNMGLDATLYSGPSRLGGRIATAANLMAPGLTTELGGEFIDSIHDDLLGLARWFGLPLIDVQAPSESGLVVETYLLNGRRTTNAELVESFMPIVRQVTQDLHRMGSPTAFHHNARAVQLDQLSIDAYLDSLQAPDPIRTLLRVAYLTEYGLPTDEQSSINLIFLVGTDLRQGFFSVLGESDERYKIAGGNQLVITALAEQLRDRLVTGHNLVALRARQDGTYALNFATGGHSTREVVADFVVLAIPFTTLRDVDLRVPMPQGKRRAIDELGYGNSAKILAGTTRRIWREQGYSGTAYADAGYEVWDNSRLQPGVAGGLTFFLGADQAADAGHGSTARQLDKYLPSAEQIFPGVKQVLNGNLGRATWPDDPWVRAGYAAFRVGQFTTIAGYEILPVGNIFFAGEHCSYDFQGYMNGAAETGRVAAENLAAAVYH